MFMATRKARQGSVQEFRHNSEHFGGSIHVFVLLCRVTEDKKIRASENLLDACAVTGENLRFVFVIFCYF